MLSSTAVYHLRKAEVEYELKIRGISEDGSADKLRKRLIQCLSSGVEIEEAVVNAMDPDSEIEECDTTCRDLSSKISEYDGNFRDNEYQRLSFRLVCLANRIERIPIGASLEFDIDQRKSELCDKVKRLQDSFVPKSVTEPDPKSMERIAKEQPLVNTQDTSSPSKDFVPAPQTRNADLLSFSKLTNDTSAAPVMQSKQQTGQPRGHNPFQEFSNSMFSGLPSTKSIPVYKWGLKFDNSSGQSVGAFLERVEELRRARGVSPTELFESAVDLFSGPALTWYRSTISRIKTWEELCKELKIVFQAPDYDYRLQQEIFYRVQGENEPIDMYIACMEGLFVRLASPVSEETRLKQIMHNLHPHLQDRLALFEITSIGELRQLGRKAEAGRLRLNNRPSTQHMSTLEPDLAFQEPTRRRNHQIPRVASARLQSSTTNEIKCWNCGITGHRYFQCAQDRKRFCYGCGQPNVLKVNCQKCLSKNAQGRGPAPSQ